MTSVGIETVNVLNEATRRLREYGSDVLLQTATKLVDSAVNVVSSVGDFDWYAVPEVNRDAQGQPWPTTLSMLGQGRVVMGVHNWVWISFFAGLFMILRRVLFRYMENIGRKHIFDDKYLEEDKRILIREEVDGIKKKISKEKSKVDENGTTQVTTRRMSIHTEKKEKPRQNHYDMQTGIVLKFMKYVYHICCYSFMFVWSLYLLYRLPWSWFNTKVEGGGFLGLLPLPRQFSQLAATYPDSFDILREPQLMQELMLFCCVQCGWYVGGMLETITYDRHRGDFWMMILHHGLAIALIYGSQCSDSHRVALHVTATLDVADILLYGLKLYHLTIVDFSGKPKNYRASLHQSLSLPTLTLVWAATRIWMYGCEIKVMWDFDLTKFREERPTMHGYIYIGHFLRQMLAAMWVLQAIWFVYIVKMAIQQLREGNFNDVVHADHAKNKNKAEKTKSLKTHSPLNKKNAAKTSNVETVILRLNNENEVKEEDDSSDNSNTASTVDETPAEVLPKVTKRKTNRGDVIPTTVAA